MLNVTQLLGAAPPRALKDMTEVLLFETHLSRVGQPRGVWDRCGATPGLVSEGESKRGVKKVSQWFVNAREK